MGSTYATLFATALLIAALPAQADVYKYIDEDGNVVYSDEPPENAQAEKVRLEPYGPSSTPTPIARVRRNGEPGRNIEQVDPERIEMLARQQVADHERRCNAARVDLADIQKPDARASEQDIEIRRNEVEKWCTQ